jgi:uncharacterized protein (TIGR02246 family)
MEPLNVEGSSSSWRHEVVELLERYESAFNANDARAMNHLFADGCAFVNFGGHLVEGKEALLAAQRAVFDPGGALEAVSVRYDPVRITELAPEVVALHARQRTLGWAAGEGRDPMAAVLLVVVRREAGGAASIVLGQNTPVKPTG